MTEQNKSSGAWSKKEKKIVLREGKRKEERIFAEFLKNQFVDSSSIYVERNFSPINCAKTWIFMQTPHHHTSIRRAALLLALTVCKNRIHPFMKNEVKAKGEGGYLIWKMSVLIRWLLQKIFIGVENWKK